MNQDVNFQKQLIKRWEKGLSFTYFNQKNKEESQIFLFLNQINRLILVGKSNEKKIYFNLEKVQIYKFNFEKEIKYKLPRHKYLLLKEPYEDDIILIFPTPKLRNFMFEQISTLLQTIQDQVNIADPLSVKLFLQADVDESMTITPDQIRTIYKIIQAEYDNQIEELIKFVNSRSGYQNDVELSLKNFLLLAQLFYSRKEIIHLYERYCKGKIETYEDYLTKSMHINEFKSFLIKQQNEAKRNAERIADSVFEKQQYISFVQFSGYMMSPNNDVLDLKYYNEPIPVNHPLTEYYCYSSHNTYLTGNQLTSDSKAERYNQDLENGLRCVEIDVHDGVSGPIVKHGFTATASVNFEDVIQSIADFCEENDNHTPIILSIENHCGTQNQYEMAETMELLLGNRILRIEEYPDFKFPTLEECMGRIIVKGSGSYEGYMQTVKKGDISSSISRTTSMMQEEPESNINFTPIKEVPQQFKSLKKSFNERVSTLEKEKEEFIEKAEIFENFIKEYRGSLTVSIKKKKINSRMLLLTSMLAGGKMGNPCPWESLSINESKLQKYFNKEKEKVRAHTNVGWVRSYPDGTRFDSSNYNPFMALELGVQIIALNTQNADLFTLCMKRFFLRNFHLRKGYRYKERKENQAIKELSIMPISCIRLRSQNQKRIPKVQVKMCLYGESTDTKLNSKIKKLKPFTEVIEGNAFNPIFKDPKNMTVRCKNPESSFVIIEVEECGVTALPVSHIKKGYRAAKLFNNEYEFNGSKVFFWIE